MRWLVLAGLLGCSTARAADVALTAGVQEVVLLSPLDHGGFYPSVGGALSLPVWKLTVTLGLSLEWSFEFKRGGLVGSVAADCPLNDVMGVDLNVIFLHDQPSGYWKQSVFFLGVGPGASFFLGKWVVSPFVNLVGGLSSAASGWSLVPGVNVSFVL